MKNYYTESEYKQLVKHIVILHSGAEQVNNHILDVFDKEKIKHKEKALKTGDYSFMVEACPELGFNRDTYFTDELCIERKNSVSELASCFSNQTKDDRFMKELNRMINIDRVYLLVENDRIEDIFEHNYTSKYNENSFIRTLFTWQVRSHYYLYFVQKENMARVIYEICKNCLDSKVLK